MYSGLLSLRIKYDLSSTHIAVTTVVHSRITYSTLNANRHSPEVYGSSTPTFFGPLDNESEQTEGILSSRWYRCSGVHTAKGEKVRL